MQANTELSAERRLAEHPLRPRVRASGTYYSSKSKWTRIERLRNGPGPNGRQLTRRLESSFNFFDAIPRFSKAKLIHNALRFSARTNIGQAPRTPTVSHTFRTH
jgi:hypothetical protein